MVSVSLRLPVLFASSLYVPGECSLQIFTYLLKILYNFLMPPVLILTSFLLEINLSFPIGEKNIAVGCGLFPFPAPVVFTNKSLHISTLW